jgi:hypothetical protein
VVGGMLSKESLLIPVVGEKDMEPKEAKIRS